jgi:hypothetical protein
MTVWIINWTVSNRPIDLISVMTTRGVGVGVGVDVGVAVGIGVRVAVPVGTGVTVWVGVVVGVAGWTVGQADVEVGVGVGVSFWRAILLQLTARTAPPAMVIVSRAKSTISGMVHLGMASFTGLWLLDGRPWALRRRSSGCDCTRCGRACQRRLLASPLL